MRGSGFARLAEAGLLLVTVLVILAYPARYNWDMVPYAAIAKSWYVDDPERLHAHVFDDLRASVPEDRFDDLVSAHPYQRSIHESPQHLANQLPFYAAKPLYPSLIALLHAAGLGLATAGILVSKLALALSLLVVHAWLSGRAGRAMSAFVSCFIFLSPPVLAFSGWSTPDPLFGLVLLLFLLVAVHRRAPRAAMLLWPVMVLCRPDAVILVAVSAAYLLHAGKTRGLTLAASGLVVLQYFLQLRAAGSPGWPALFHHTFVERQLDPAALDAELGLGDYLSVYVTRFFEVDTLTMIWWIALAAAFALHYRIRLGRHSRAAAMIGVLAAYSALHWLAFPTEKYRLLFPAYLSFVVLAAAMILGAGRLRRKDEPSRKSQGPDGTDPESDALPQTQPDPQPAGPRSPGRRSPER